MPRTGLRGLSPKHSERLKNQNPMLSVPKPEKHRQNRSKPLTRAPTSNDELAPATDPSPSPYQNADIHGHLRFFSGKSGQVMPGRWAGGTTPLAPQNGGPNRRRIALREIRPYPAKSGQKRPDPATLGARRRTKRGRSPFPAQADHRSIDGSWAVGSGSCGSSVTVTDLDHPAR
jgi:hypothetical protein